MENFYCRAKAKSDGTWVSGFYFYIQNKGHFILTPVASIEIDPQTRCYYFGLKDVNGTHVFTGDILCERYTDESIESEVCIYNEVAFIDGSFGVIGEVTGELIPFSEYPITDQYVAGNKFDNYKLLNNNENRN